MSLPDPTPVTDLIEAFRRSKTMFTAVGLGVFDLLREAPADAAGAGPAAAAEPPAGERR